MGRGDWQATVYGVTKNQTQLNNSFVTGFYVLRKLIRDSLSFHIMKLLKWNLKLDSHSIYDN